jgi:hypothetical protein
VQYNRLMAWSGVCEHCHANFAIEIFHNGFGDTSYAYCDTCGQTTILSGWNKRWPEGVKCTQAEIAPEMEPHLQPCGCGGKFTRGNSPRCPACARALSAELAAEYLERQAPGTKKGWHWQRTWSGIYCAVINGRSVKDNFTQPE